MAGGPVRWTRGGDSVMRGNGEVRAGLGWPRLGSGDLATLLKRHGGSSGAGAALLIAAPAPVSSASYEDGVGWPADTAGTPGSLDATVAENQPTTVTRLAEKSQVWPGPVQTSNEAGRPS